jgi:NRAMP (natural resistance-associated macrophage protein)-like metal ion transporter
MPMIPPVPNGQRGVPATARKRASGAVADIEPQANPLKRFFKILGPGLITGASDDDPSGIGTYAMVGASLGYSTLWTALATFPLMAAIQFICAKIGLVAGRGLAGVLRQHYPRAVLYPTVLALTIANTINAGVDIGAVAAGLNLLLPGVSVAAFVVPVALVLLTLQIWGSYRLIVNTFKWLTLSLFAYIGAAFFARPDWSAILHGTFVPTVRLDAQFLASLVAILGTTISPYLFFWQASQEAEEKYCIHRHNIWRARGTTDAELKYCALDVTVGMFFSNVVMYFVILTTAATLHQSGKTEIGTATEAAEALIPLAGDAASILLALGLVGTGLLAVPVLTASSAYAVAETFRWNSSLDAKPQGAREFYGVIAVSTLIGLGINFMGFNPMSALFWTSVINGFMAPPLLVVIMQIANNRDIMGERVNGWGLNVLGWLTAGVMFAAAARLILTWGD